MIHTSVRINSLKVLFATNINAKEAAFDKNFLGEEWGGGGRVGKGNEVWGNKKNGKLDLTIRL